MNKAEESSLTECQQYWLNHIRTCEASGKSIADYAVEHEISAKTMYAGKKMLVKKGILPRTHANRFQRAQLTHMAVSHDWRIQLPNGVSIAFSGAVEANTLSTVLNTAAAIV
jgi:hypothetical protein